MTTQKFQVGQQLYWVALRSKERHFVTIKKVGSKYLHVTDHIKAPVDKTTLQASLEGYGYIAQCYLSLEAYEQAAAADAAWSKLRHDLNHMHSHRPSAVTLEDITQARRLLLNLDLL